MIFLLLAGGVGFGGLGAGEFFGLAGRQGFGGVGNDDCFTGTGGNGGDGKSGTNKNEQKISGFHVLGFQDI
jgi:hypothetical protein